MRVICLLLTDRQTESHNILKSSLLELNYFNSVTKNAENLFIVTIIFFVKVSQPFFLLVHSSL